METEPGDLTPYGVCPGPAISLLICRDRELANLRSLLRSVTISLENAAGRLEHPCRAGDIEQARVLIDHVLEALS